ncbi:E3 ubiquitin-protein ligase MARCH6, partial [Paragonimus westermani]
FLDFCRVCRCEATKSRPLFYPCLCTGSIKYIHQDCLLRWLQYSKRHTCELCNHRFSFAPIYASGTPRFLPIRVLLVGLIRSLRRSFVGWLHLSLVFLAWLVVVPLTACRIYRCLFTGSVSSLLTLPLDMLSTRYLMQDCLQGFTIVFLALAAFLGYISLREQLLHGGGPAWLEQVAAGDNEERDANGRPPFFPDLFNLFGAANGADPGAVVGEDENAEEIAVPQPPTSDPVDRSVRLSSASDADPAAATSGFIPSDGASSAEPNLSVPIELVNQLPVQPQQYGWRADGLGANEVGDEDRAAEEPDGDGVADAGADNAAVDGAMNWDRLLGLDGSLAFLEHMLWLIALNTLLIVIFAFCPYYLGQFTVLGLRLEKLIATTHMEGLSTSLVGYVIVAAALVLLHYVFKYFGMPRAGYWFGLGYVYIKVALVSLLEVGIFPILCGFWIDACTLTVGENESPLDYSVEIILIQVVLPFLLDVQAKAAVRKLLRAWCMGVGTALGIRSYLVGDEPFVSGDLIVNEDGAEVPYVPPTSRDSEMPPTTSGTQHSPHVATESTQTGLPNIPQLPEPEVHPVPGPARPDERHAREDHENDEDPDNFNRYVPYKRSTWFPLRLFSPNFSLPSILASAWRTISVLLSQTGRLLSLSQTWRVLRIWTRSGTTCEISIPRPALPPPISHLRGTSIGVDTASLLRVLERARNATQLFGVAILFLVLLPVCLGLLINLMFIIPFQLGPKKTLVVGFWELWIFGIMHLKVIILLTLTGPSWWLRQRLEAVQDELVQRRYDARSRRILNEITPLLVIVGMCLAVPYLLAYYSAGWFGLNFEFALRYVYVGLFGASLLFVLVGFQTKQLQNLYTRIKDEKYLIGRRLLNFRATEPEASSSDHIPDETATNSMMLSASM